MIYISNILINDGHLIVFTEYAVINTKKWKRFIVKYTSFYIYPNVGTYISFK